MSLLLSGFILTSTVCVLCHPTMLGLTDGFNLLSVCSKPCTSLLFYFKTLLLAEAWWTQLMHFRYNMNIKHCGHKFTFLGQEKRRSSLTSTTWSRRKLLEGVGVKQGLVKLNNTRLLELTFLSCLCLSGSCVLQYEVMSWIKPKDINITK